MLGRLFIALCALPGFKKLLWRTWYNYLARVHRLPEWTFMNYGYVPSAGSPLTLESRDIPDQTSIALYHHVAAAVPLTGAVVLEVGSGRGGGASFVKRYLGPVRVLGVDLSKEAVELSRERHHVDGLAFQVGDAENLPVPSDSIDAVVNVESSHCYPGFEKFLAETKRVLRPGGHLLHTDFRDRDNVETWSAQLRNSGMQLLSETDITPNVIAALERDSDSKTALIKRMIPRLLQPSFNDFAGVRGSVIFEGFTSGRLIYKSYVLRKADKTEG